MQAYADYSECPPDDRRLADIAHLNHIADRSLADALAQIKVPVPRNLAQIAQIRGIIDEDLLDPLALKEDYIKFVKSRLFELAEAGGVMKELLDESDAQFDDLRLTRMSESLGFPGYGDEHSHPLLLLANLDLPIYLTTGYHEYLEAALVKAGKDPQSDFCRWHGNIKRYPSVFDKEYEPSVQKPLVYHLHGLDRYEDMMVLTEDDHLTFLSACAQNIAKTDCDPVHLRVRQALAEGSLLLLGYELHGWDFRSLFWGLIKPRPRSYASAISIQLEPSVFEKQYLERYLAKYNFDVAWVGFRDYVASLWKAVKNG